MSFVFKNGFRFIENLNRLVWRVPISPAPFSLPPHTWFPLTLHAHTLEETYQKEEQNRTTATSLPPQIKEGSCLGQMALEQNAYIEVRLYFSFLEE